MSKCSIDGCDNEMRHSMRGFIVRTLLCCEHVQQRLDVLEEQIEGISQELAARGLTSYGQKVALKGRVSLGRGE